MIFVLILVKNLESNKISFSILIYWKSNKKLKLEEVEPIDDQICEDVSRFGATFR